ncbi:CGNR zinc finger domain-containing protein [Nocardia vulneris]|uniref:CGNR zinc finger domain-containing protein n=1 Tax=Nocardia vulneris TaxID=1141657 RepID=UPI0030D4D187
MPELSALEPGLSGFEQVTSRAPHLRAMVASAVRGDHGAAAHILNSLMEQAGITVRVHNTVQGWTLEADAPVSAAECLLSIAQLVAADGWRRVKICDVRSCPAVFIDRTNGNNRRYCDSHRRKAGYGVVSPVRSPD